MPPEAATLSGTLDQGRLSGLDLTLAPGAPLAQQEVIRALDDYFAMLRRREDASAIEHAAQARTDFRAVVRQNGSAELQYVCDDTSLTVRRDVPKAIAAQFADGVAKTLN